jgi:hypothetical protein
MHLKSNYFLQTSSSPEREIVICDFPTVNTQYPDCMSSFPLDGWQFLTAFGRQSLSADVGTLSDRSYPPQGLQITGRNATGPSGHYHLTRSGSVTATKETTADVDAQATTSPSPLVLDSRTMSIVVPRKLGPRSEAEKSASKQLRQTGGAYKKHRLGKKRVSPHCPPKIKNYVN